MLKSEVAKKPMKKRCYFQEIHFLNIYSLLINEMLMSGQLSPYGLFDPLEQKSNKKNINICSLENIQGGSAHTQDKCNFPYFETVICDFILEDPNKERTS